MIGVCAIVIRVGAVPHVGRAAGDFDQWGVCHPVPQHLGPVGVGLIVGIAGESRCELEVSAVGNGVLQIVAREVRINLPAEAATAGRGIPQGGLKVVDGLSEREP